MNFFLQNRTATIIIVVLIVLNLSSIYFFVVHKRISPRRHFSGNRPAWQDKRDRPKGAERPQAHFMEKELGLSKEQSKKFKELRRLHFSKSATKRKEMRSLRELMFDNINNQSFNADSTATIISQAQLEIELGMFEHFKAIREICTEEQKIKFDKMIGRIMQKMTEHGTRQMRNRPDKN